MAPAQSDQQLSGVPGALVPNRLPHPLLGLSFGLRFTHLRGTAPPNLVFPSCGPGEMHVDEPEELGRGVKEKTGSRGGGLRE